MNGTYNIILKSQLGPKSGTLFLKATRRRLWCCLDILGNENILVGVHDRDTFYLKGGFKTALGSAKCELSGKLLGPCNFDNIGSNAGKTIEVAENAEAAGIPGENLLEASICIDGKEYQISGTLA